MGGNRSRRVIAVHSDLGAGRESVAAHLVKSYDFHTLRFEDPIRVLITRQNPIVDIVDGRPVRVHQLLRTNSWSRAKMEHPELARVMATLATAITSRLMEPSYWRDVLMGQIRDEYEPDDDLVIPDLRFRDEYDYVTQHLNARVWWVHRADNPYDVPLGPSILHPNGPWRPPTAEHLYNDGTLEHLRAKVDELMEHD